MSKRMLLAGASALLMSFAVPAPSTAEVPYSVYAVQRALNELGYAAGTADGQMGSKTRTAIRAYQIDKGLPQSGEPSRSLYDHLQRNLTPVVAQAAPGLDSARVAEIQERLRERGYGISTISGALDAATVAAIRAYQRDAGLPVTGDVSSALSDQLRIGGTSGSGRPLDRAEVARLQAALNKRGYAAGPEDGVSGPRVRTAIRAFQADAGLPETGEATQGLLAALETAGGSGGSPAAGSLTSLAQVEAELGRRGYYVGDLDGIMDDQLRAAIRSFQGDAGATATGEADAALLASLKTSAVRNRGETNSLLVWEIENRLDRLGYAVGPIDGTVDDQARLAVSTYQRQADIRQDGRTSFELLDHIDRSGGRNDSETASSLIWNVETELARRNFRVGPIDGTMDERTEAAIRAYEGEVGLESTGRASAALLVSLESSDAQNVPQSDVREIERRLQRRGYSVGVADGTVDAQTVAAIEAYQKDAGLVVTGRQSVALLQHLRSSGTKAPTAGTTEVSVQQLIDAFRKTIERAGGN